MSCRWWFLLLLVLLVEAQQRGRKRRAITFPKSSSFILTMTFLKAIQLKEPANWNLDLEFDMIWPIPEGVQTYQKKKVFRPRPSHHKRRHRRELYDNFAAALDSQGLPGKHCILRTICEAKVFLSPPGVSLVEDLLRLIFSYPSASRSEYDVYDNAYQTKSDCDFAYACPFSILDLLLNYQNDVK